jgi:hypothetical protein
MPAGRTQSSGLAVDFRAACFVKFRYDDSRAFQYLMKIDYEKPERRIEAYPKAIMTAK